MGTQNLLNYYSNKLDAKISYDSYYDFYLASDEDNFQREVVYSDNIIGYTEPRTPQVGNVSGVLPLWIDLNNTGCTMQPLLTGVSTNQQMSKYSGATSRFIGESGFPQSIISQNYWDAAYSYCGCPYTGFGSDNHSFHINNAPLNGVDIGTYNFMYGNFPYRLYDGSIPISGWCNCMPIYSADTCSLNGQTGCKQITSPFQIFDIKDQDSRYKMWQVSANTQAPSQSGATSRNVSSTFFKYPDSGYPATPGPEDSSKFDMTGSRRYTISSSTDSSGYYQELNGGYYTGAYRYYGYPYSVLPDRPAKGWTMETFLKIRATGTTTGGTCFSTNYNPEKNVRVNKGDGCYAGPFPLTDGYTRNGEPVETVYYTNPMWNTGVTVTNTGVTVGDSVDCTTLYKKGACVHRDNFEDGDLEDHMLFGDYYCENGELIDEYCSQCATDSRGDFCDCCATLGFNVPVNPGDTYEYSYVIDSEGPCVNTSCYGMKYTGYDYVDDVWLTARTENLNCTADTRTVNDDYPNNSGFFYYIGTRAENKFHKEFPSETGCTSMSGYNCCNSTISGHTLGPATVFVEPYDIATGGTSTTITMTSTTEDVLSNSIGFRITPDFKIGYRALRFTGVCESTGGIAAGEINDCNTGTTFVCGYDIEEAYSDSIICPSIINSGTCEDTWIHVAVSFERDMPLVSGTSCGTQAALSVEFNLGGLLDPLYLFSGITSEEVNIRCNNVFDELPLIPEDGKYMFDCDNVTNNLIFDTPPFLAFDLTVNAWLEHDEYRRGKLVFYVNGRRHFVVENFEEIIPRALNQHRDLQVGVPFNMAWGGASIGLLENMTLSPCYKTGLSADTCDLSTISGGTGYTSYTACTLNDTPQMLEQDPDDLGLLIEQNFAGTWMGGISQLRYYSKPLQADELYHNFLVNKDRYQLIDCEFAKNCSKNACDSSQTLYLTEGNMYDIKGIFGYLSNNLYFTTGTNQVKFRGYTQENISSVKFYKKYKQEIAVEVTMPVWMNPEDTLEVVIVKMDESLESIVTLLGNTYK
tara:strand:- start:1708 stop:4797 length:3090 start_codon:yes stop_codon:yes gene_type:complete